MDYFCDDQYEKCPHAKKLTEAYEKGEKTMTDNKINSLEDENKKINVMLSKAEARCDAKDKQIKDLQRRNEVVFQKYNKQKERLAEIEETGRKAVEQFNQAALICEARVAYLLSLRDDQFLDEEKFKAWHEEHDFAVVPEVEGEQLKGWKLSARVSVKEIMDEKDGARGSASESESTGRKETEKAF